MVIDTSALLAILKVEPEALSLIAVLSEAGVKWISTATLLETRLVVEAGAGPCALGSGGLAPLRQRSSQRGVEPGRLLQLWPGTSPG